MYLAIGVDCDGAKQVLGMWIGPSTGESAKFWLSVLSELKSRGVQDVCIVCCDGLTGLPDAIGVIWPQATVQLCVVHLIRASLRYASKKDWTPLCQSLRPIYTAVDEQAAAAELEVFAEKWSVRYPAIVRLWRAHWAEFVPFLAFPPEVRRVIYTTNLIESMIQRDDPVVEPVQPGLPLPHDLGFKAAGAVPRHLQIDPADISEQRFRGRPVATVPRAATRWIMLLIAQMRGQFLTERPL